MATDMNVLISKNDASKSEINADNVTTAKSQSADSKKEKIYGEFVSEAATIMLSFQAKGFAATFNLKRRFCIGFELGAIFLSAVSGIGALIGFGATLAAARKTDPKYFEDGVVRVKGVRESGASLALRALGWGTVYAVGGCGILFYGIWKLSGATNAEEFRYKMGSILPRIPRNNPPQSRTEFQGLTDLLTYISNDWDKEKTKNTK